jgi:hypothetical protein
MCLWRLSRAGPNTAPQPAEGALASSNEMVPARLATLLPTKRREPLRDDTRARLLRN